MPPQPTATTATTTTTTTTTPGITIRTRIAATLGRCTGLGKFRIKPGGGDVSSDSAENLRTQSKAHRACSMMGVLKKSATVQKLRQIPGLLLQNSRLSLEKYDHLRTLTNRMHLQCHLLPSLKLTAISPLKIVHPTPQKETIVFQPSIFRVLCQCHVFFHGG